MSRVIQRKTILAKLMAKEDIEVVTGKYNTASFDVTNRILRIPAWSDMSDELWDLFVSHEVGHALYTPTRGWKDFTKREKVKGMKVNDGVKFGYLNVVEDIRIERKVISQYPGLNSRYRIGYGELGERKFFGEKKIKSGAKNAWINGLNFIDRLNIKAKMREHVTIKFTDEEMVWVNKADDGESL